MTVGSSVPAMTFSVRSCEAVYIALSEIPGVTNTASYEVVIGNQNNSNIVIKNRVDGEIKATSPLSRYLDCQSDSDFWVSWENEEISVGLGLSKTFTSFIVTNFNRSKANKQL